MTIETKYNIGDVVWIRVNENPTCAEISYIVVRKHGDIFYGFKFFSEKAERCVYPDKDTVPTKEELFKSLLYGSKRIESRKYN